MNEACRREIERLTIAREVLSGLVTGPAESIPAGRFLAVRLLWICHLTPPWERGVV
ncbi:hypothetical protein Acy02nite_91780 [Actinoplanes cyaneus]|uniref:Uncharacterized protein n=1 Tax=Actinoplanes cyaneus TaxID=52696 RepID=A0A919IVK9_9ACTN|nr:hypothetical protein Acy02nite_91780 [Actinoplanes cyaneus]